MNSEIPQDIGPKQCQEKIKRLHYEFYFPSDWSTEEQLFWLDKRFWLADCWNEAQNMRRVITPHKQYIAS